jgi:protein-disulfide isomerase
VALLVAAWRACRPEGVAAAVRGDLAVLRRRPLVAAGLALAAVCAVALAAAAYPRYWERRSAKVAAPTPPAPAPAADAANASPGPLVVVEFSDYECPFCAKSHEDTKALLAVRPDVRLVRRHFPLDSACNPALTRRLHPQACALARAAICAEEQGKLDPMDDLLFRNQQAKRPIEELAAAVGLDLPRFRACLVEPATEARLRSDIEAGVRAGLQATPTYVIGGRAYSGQLPVELLPPPRAASADRAPPR